MVLKKKNHIIMIFPASFITTKWGKEEQKKEGIKRDLPKKKDW